jgi:hypothetical protein
MSRPAREFVHGVIGNVLAAIAAPAFVLQSIRILIRARRRKIPISNAPSVWVQFLGAQKPPKPKRGRGDTNELAALAAFTLLLGVGMLAARWSLFIRFATLSIRHRGYQHVRRHPPRLPASLPSLKFLYIC